MSEVFEANLIYNMAEERFLSLKTLKALSICEMQWQLFLADVRGAGMTFLSISFISLGYYVLLA